MATFDTIQPSQVKALNGYTVDPIFTVGDKIGNYVPPGILDGIGAYSLDDTTVRILVVNEVAATDGYKYTLKNATQLSGARVNYFDVDKRTLQIVNAGLAYDTIINRAGEVVDAAADLEFSGIQRFCSAALFEANQFGAGIGLADRIFFSGEETSNGTQFALDTQTNTLYAVPAFGRASWENVTELNTGSASKVAFLIGDDSNNAPLYLYIGNKTTGGFLERNGLARGQGKLFVWVADDPADNADAIEANPSQFKGSGTSTNGQFVEIAYYDPTKANTTGYDAQGFATQAKQNELATAVNAFRFSRPEDIATNPFDGTQAVLASTGITAGPDVWGTTYKIDVDFSQVSPTARIDILYDGNDAGKQDFGLRSPDNLDWADNGKIYIQEDRALASTIWGATSREEASIYVLDPAAANPANSLTKIAQVDRSAVPSGQTDSSPTDIGNWETSGILDVSTLFGNAPGTQFIFDVQAHSLLNGSIITATNIDGNGDGTKTRQENLVEGGQLSFLIAPNANLIQDTQFHAGTSNADIIVAKQAPGFGGINDVVFSGAGDDEIDSTAAGALASNNIIDAGSGGDTVYLANGDRAFGSDGNDEFFGDGASNFRASGGAGNDIFYLGDGSNGRALGGDGNDIFGIGLGGGHTLSGGAGADEFYIVSGALTEATNTILDFQIGTDKIRIAGAVNLGITTANLTLTQVGADTAVIFSGQTLATLTGIQASALSVANPNQFILG
jgi:serralysin